MRGVLGVDLGDIAVLQLLDRSIARHSSHPDNLGDLRSNRRHCGRDWKRRHCNNHCVLVSSRTNKAEGLCLTTHHNIPRLHVAADDRSHTDHGRRVDRPGNRRRCRGVGRSHHHSRPEGGGQTFWVMFLLQ